MAKILIYDIETAPTMGWVWSLWKQNVGLNQIIEPGYLLCWVAKYLGEEDVYYDANWLSSREDTVLSLHGLMDEADILVAHFGNKFDRPTMNAEFMKLGIEPPAPSRSVDTCAVAKNQFRLLSNKLDYLGEYLGVGKKIKTDFDLWTDVMAGDKLAQQDMLDYNEQDVHLLEAVYLKMLPWITNHPNVALFDDVEDGCTNCGGSHLQSRGWAYTNVFKYKRYQCQDCGTWLRGRHTAIDRERAKRILTQDKNK